MEITAPSSKKYILKYGVLLGILSVLLGIVIYATDNSADPHIAFTIAGYVIIIGAIVTGIQAYKKDNNGYLSIVDALKIGIGTALIGGIIAAIWTVILMTILEPEMIVHIQEAQKIAMEKQFPDMPQEQKDQALAISRKMASPFAVATIILVTNLFLGFIISLITGLIMQKKEELI